MSSAWAGRFLTTGSPGKPYFSFFYWSIIAFFFFFGVGSFPHSSVGKESAGNAEDPALIPRSGRSPGEGNGNPLQYSGLKITMDRGAWQATVHGVTGVGHDLATKLLIL